MSVASTKVANGKGKGKGTPHCERKWRGNYRPLARGGLDRAKEIREVRAALYLTQKELGAILGVTHWTINKWETGLKTVRPLVIFAMWHLLAEVE